MKAPGPDGTYWNFSNPADRLKLWRFIRKEEPGLCMALARGIKKQLMLVSGELMMVEVCGALSKEEMVELNQRRVEDGEHQCRFWDDVSGR